jgi:hypothetical protein
MKHQELKMNLQEHMSNRSSTTSLGKLSLALFLCGTASVQVAAQVISAPNLKQFEPRDVGTTSEVRQVRISLNHPLAISSIALAPGFSDFSITGPVTGCVVDGHTVNPAFTGCQLPVVFQPKFPGYRSAPLIVTDNTGARYSVGLTGTGLAPQAAFTPGIATSVAGGGPTPYFGGDGGPATQANLNEPFAVVVDSAGNYYIADSANNRVRKVDTNGIITTYAGTGQGGYSGDGGPAINAELFPRALALDAANNLYIINNSSVRKVDAGGIITTVVNGSKTSGFSGDGGPAIDAQLFQPLGISIDAKGNIYIADTSNYRVRKIDTSGIITTVAGNGTSGRNGDGGPATSAQLGYTQGVAVDSLGNLYIADGRIRKVDTSGILTTIAGQLQHGFSGDGGPAVKAYLNIGAGVTVDPAGNIYILDAVSFSGGNDRIRRIDTNGTITTIAGNGNLHNQNPYNLPATETTIAPSAVALDSAGNLYISDYLVDQIVKVTVGQPVAPFAAHTVGATSPNRRVVLTNTGNQHLDLTGLDVPKPFGLLTGNDPSYCTPTSDLGPGFSCALPITFTPTAAGPVTGAATVTDNSLNQPGTTQSVSLSGTGVNP